MTIKVVYMLFFKSLQRSKSAITMRPVSMESTLLLFLLIQGVLQKSISNLKYSYSKKYDINSNKIFKVVKVFHCLHLEVFTD